MKKICCLVIFLFLGLYAQAQYFEKLKEEKEEEVIPEDMPDRVSFGAGLGLDYGGIGVSALGYFTDQLGVFVGVGYAFAGAGFNAGLKFRLLSDNRVEFYTMAMYGYNGAVAVINAPEYNKFFYGPSVAFGIDMHSGDIGYWTFGLTYPIRNGDYEEYVNYLSTNHGIRFESSPLPVTPTVGYRFILGY